MLFYPKNLILTLSKGKMPEKLRKFDKSKDMKYHHLPLFISLFVLSCQQNQPAQLPADELPKALETFNSAFATGNLDILDSLTMDNYMHTNSSSKAITKEDWFNYLLKRKERLESGNLEVLDYTLEEEKLTYHGTTAIVTGKVNVATRDSSGIKRNQYRITNVWVWDKGQWKRAGFHDGKIQ